MAHNRVVQWSTMCRTWWLYDARQQCVFRSAHKISKYIRGMHKPIFHPLSDIGDHVVVINCKHIAMPGNDWRTRKYFHHTGYPKGFTEISAWRIHELEPTRLMQEAVYMALRPGYLVRRTRMRRLHLYPEEEVPPDILNNVSDVIKQVQTIHKSIEEYTQEELDEFPKLFDWPKQFVLPEKLPLPEPGSDGS